MKGVDKKKGKQPVVDLDEDDDDDMAAKRAITRWNRNEEILLAETWIEHSQDANIRKDQQDDVYWNPIMQDFNSQTTDPPRAKKSDADLVENAKTSYMERYGNKKFQYDHVWNILKNYPKWNAAEPIDEDNLLELFGPDPRERPAGKQWAPKNQISVDTSSAGGSTGRSTRGSQSESVSGVEDDISKFVKIRLDAHGIDMENSVTGSNTVKNHRLIGIASEVPGDIYYYAHQPPTLMKHLETNKNNDDATRLSPPVACTSTVLVSLSSLASQL
ncbi:hypothetical protein Tco_1459149 [Tanacetum coccineum]